jgi:hypothetical protein
MGVLSGLRASCAPARCIRMRTVCTLLVHCRPLPAARRAPQARTPQTPAWAPPGPRLCQLWALVRVRLPRRSADADADTASTTTLPRAAPARLPSGALPPPFCRAMAPKEKAPGASAKPSSSRQRSTRSGETAAAEAAGAGAPAAGASAAKPGSGAAPAEAPRNDA